MRFIYFIILIKISFNLIVLPFKEAYVNKNGNINKENEEYNSTHFLNDYFDVKLYSTIKIGDPPQEVKVLLTSKACAFKIGKSDYCINSTDYLSYYNRNKSKDFIYTTKYNMTLTEFDNEKGYTSEDSMYAYTDLNLNNEQKFKNIGFFLGSDTNDKLCGIIGFKMDNYAFYCNKINDIIRSFKSNEIINNYKWVLKYTSLGEGYYIIGSEMKDIMNNFEENKLFITKSLMFGGEYTWGFYIQEIKCEKDKNRITINKEQKRGEIENDFSLIIGSNTYFKYINETFFNEYFIKGFCVRNIWKKNQFYDYYVIECDKKNFGKNDIMKLPELIFDVKDEKFNGEFILDYNDLFTETKYKYFFNIIFHTYQNEIWTLGKIFLKKYPVIFDLDSKMIEIYDGYYKEQSNNENLNQISKGRIILYICIVIVLICITGVIGYFLGKNLNKLRKRKANELIDDDYDYSSKENNGINTNS